MTKIFKKVFNYSADFVQELQRTWHQTIPLSKAMNIEVCHYDENSLSTHCDDAFNQNLHNTMFAGSIYTLATLTGWGWAYLQLKRLDLLGNIVLADANIRYLSPIKGSAIAKTTGEQTSGNLNALKKGKKARLNIEVNIISGDKISASFKGVYVIVPA